MYEFTPDEKIQAIAEAYFLDALDFARSMGVTLDSTDASVADVEEILAKLCNELDLARPPEDKIVLFAKILGSYVGEVFRRNHRGTWGTAALDGEKVMALQGERSAAVFWPWIRALKRIKGDSEENVWHYYCVLVEGEGDPVPTRRSAQSGRRWWRFWR